MPNGSCQRDGRHQQRARSLVDGCQTVVRHPAEHFAACRLELRTFRAGSGEHERQLDSGSSMGFDDVEDALRRHQTTDEEDRRGTVSRRRRIEPVHERGNDGNARGVNANGDQLVAHIDRQDDDGAHAAQRVEATLGDVENTLEVVAVLEATGARRRRHRLPADAAVERELAAARAEHAMILYGQDGAARGTPAQHGGTHAIVQMNDVGRKAMGKRLEGINSRGATRFHSGHDRDLPGLGGRHVATPDGEMGVTIPSQLVQ